MKYIYVNGVEKGVTEFDLPEFLKQACVYEVIRLIEGIPVFWGEHLDRFELSCIGAGVRSGFTREDIRKSCLAFIRKSNFKVGSLNIYLSIDSPTLVLFGSTVIYPTNEQYTFGIDCVTLKEERTNPNLKTSNSDVRKLANELLVTEHVFEVLLLNTTNYFTEGSRSNLFFIQDNRVYTAPSTFVLKGITRQFVIKALMDVGFEVVEQLISMETAKTMDGAFISGTSPKILPIARIDNIRYSTNWPRLRDAMVYYDQLLADYVIQYRLSWDIVL